MSIRTTSIDARMGFVVDHATVNLNSGRQVDWSRVPASFANSDGVKVIRAGTAVANTANGKMVPVHTVTLTSVSVASNVATATLANHGFKVGEIVNITGASLDYANGRKEIATVPTANTFTYAATGADGSASGTITATIAAQGFIATNAEQDSKSDSLSGHGMIVGGVLYENLLPDATGGPPARLPAQIKTDLQVAGTTTGFVFEIYGDSRAV